MSKMAQDFDYIITGAGSAGCVLAARLSENQDVSVLLLEAGGRDRNPLFHWPAGFSRMTKGIASWGWSTVPQRQMRGRELWFTQAKVLGGGSSINAQIYTRGHPADYDEWTEEGCDGWSHADVLPYFIRAEDCEIADSDFHGKDGPLGVSSPRGALPVCEAFIRAGEAYGIPRNGNFNGAGQAGVGYYQLTQRNVRRSSTATAYLAPARERPNLTVLTFSEATRILVEKGRTVGVEVRRGRNVQSYRAGREVIVTSGAIGSPRLLLLSGIGPADHLHSVDIPVTHDLPGVGENLQDHINLCAIAECTGPHSYDPVARFDRTILAGLQYILFKTGPVTSSLFETGGFWYADPEARSPDVQLHLGLGSGIEKGIAKLDAAGITLNTAYLRPRSRGTVRLASSDPSAPPLIDPNYWAEPHDLEMSLEGLRLARAILAEPAISDFVNREVLPGPDVQSREDLLDYACRMAKTDHHPVGTCRMGTGEDAVVDPELRVLGLEALRVCDSSVMPRIVSSNTNAATIMIAEKAADLILGRDPLPPSRPKRMEEIRPKPSS